MNILKEELMPFLVHDNEYVHECAGRILELVTHLDNGELSEDEFNELADDVLDLVHVAESAKGIEWQAMVETGLRALIALLPKLVGLATGK